MKPRKLPRQLYLPKFLHGHTNMESGIISLYERGQSPRQIAPIFKLQPAAVTRILRRFGY